MAKLWASMRAILAIAAPYFRSEERWSARLLLAAVIGLQLA